MSRESKDVIESLLDATGIDYSSQDEVIAKFFDEYLYHGNYDGTLEFEDSKFRSLRFIQEDEYDQHADDSMPDFDEHLTYASGHYIFFGD